MFNSLYCFIRDNLSQPSPSWNVANLIRKTHENADKRYILYSLHSRAESFSDYRFQSDHLSFYEKEAKSESDPYLTQYHYTAYFKDAADQEYQLHVYFNRRDKVMAAVFSIKDKKGNYHPLNIDVKLLDLFTQLAQEKSAAVIAELRQQHQKTIEELDKRYRALEKTIHELSQHWEEQPAAYQTCLQEMIDVLTLLAPHQREYQGWLSFCLRLKDSVAVSLPQPAAVKVPAEMKRILLDEIVDTLVEAKKEKLPLLQSLVPYIEKIASAKQAYLTADKEFKLDCLLNFIDTGKEALVVSEDKAYQVRPKEMHLLQRYMTESSEQAKKFLMQLLLAKDFKSALRLREYLSMLPNSIVAMAISTKNSVLLDFLLTEGEFAIDTIQVSQQSLALYCYNKSTDSKDWLDCFSILIKHGASLLTKAPNGMPIAFLILHTPGHPLQIAIRKNAQVFLDSRLHNAMSRLVKNQLKHGKYTPEEKKKFSETLNIIANNKKSFQGCSSASMQINSNFLLDSSEDTLSHFSEEALKSFAEDKELQEKWLELKVINQEYLNQLNPTEKKHALLAGKENSKTMNQMLEGIKDIKSSPVLKASMLVSLNRQIRQIKLVMERKTVCDEIQHMRGKVQSGRVGKGTIKEYNSLGVRDRELAQEINQLGLPGTSNSTTTSFMLELLTGKQPKPTLKLNGLLDELTKVIQENPEKLEAVAKSSEFALTSASALEDLSQVSPILSRR